MGRKAPYLPASALPEAVECHESYPPYLPPEQEYAAMRIVSRHHDISAGHRIPGHEGKCCHLHGHNYRITFTCTAPSLDELGRIIDFGEIKSRLCDWLEERWDHRMLISITDPWLDALLELDDTVVTTSFIPTAENMAEYLLTYVGPDQLAGTGITLTRVCVEETRKCLAEAYYGPFEEPPAPKLAIAANSDDEIPF